MKALLLTCLAILLSTAQLAVAGPRDASFQAQVHYQSGQRLYDAGAYHSAALEFTAAYDLSQRPELLFNLGQAYRLAGDCELARDAYQRFRAEDPTAIERTNVDERIAEMERCIAAKQTPAPEVVESTPPPELVAELPDPAADKPTLAIQPRPPRDEGRGRRWTGGALAGVGAALVGTGVYFFVRASGDAAELTGDYASGGQWSDEANHREDAISRDRRLATLLSGVGGLSMAAGAYLWWSGRKRPRTRQLAVTPTAGGAEVTWLWSF